MSTISEPKLPQVASQSPVGSAVHDSLLDQVDEGSSSSLSDPADRTGNEDGDDAQDAEEDGSDAYDTEAETERLEKTPRKNRNVLLTPSNGILPDRENLRANNEQREGSPIEDPLQAFDSSLGESGNEDEPSLSSSSSRKRKRTNFEPEHKSDRGAELIKKAKASMTSTSPSPDDSTGSPTPVAEDENQHTQIKVTQPALKQSHKKGKRKGKKTKEEEAQNKVERATLLETLGEAADHGEAASSNGEDVEMEDAVERDGAEADSAAKTEEDLAKKKTAMHALSAIENCFATLRDKLFDERLAHCNDELAMLAQSTLIHPELLLMKEVIDRRRNQKVKYERTLLKFKLESLQRESIANKSQIHSQYMQTVAELRDISLSQINAEIYQTQRERRSCEADMPDYMYLFSTKRSKQITEQTAYNEEVSLLSGVAKYVGFPAAPDIVKASVNEWEEDERTYQHKLVVEDEANNARKASQHHPPMLRASLSAASTFSRAQPAAEDQFLQQNAWANPQHPANQRHRHVSAFSQVATPANQKRVIDSQGSMSTIPEQPSAPNSSVAPTPATGEAIRDAHTNGDSAVPQSAVDATPSRITRGPMEEIAAITVQSADQPSVAATSEAEQNSTPLLSKTTGHESHTPGALPKPLPFMQSGGTSRASPPVRNPVIKAEDPSHLYRHSPIANQSLTNRKHHLS